MSPPRRFLRWATLLAAREQMVVFLRGVLVQIKMRRPQEQTLDQEGRDQTGKICAKQILTFAVGNNVGVKIAKTFFASMTYCLWCARRAHAFVAISMGCKDLSRHKVHFDPKSAFEKVTLGDHPKARTRACEPAGRLPGFDRASDRRWLILTSSGCSRPYLQSRACDQLLRPAR